MTPGLLDRDGCALVPGVLSAQECAWAVQCAQATADAVGERCLLSHAWCAELAGRLRLHTVLSTVLPADAVAVQCTYFEKSSDRNWLVPIHQDLSIAVAERVDDSRLRAWSHKEGSWFVQAPVAILEQMLALRVHLDACTDEDGPLRVVLGSHRSGLIAPDAALRMRDAGTVARCLCAPGAVLAMRPLLLHASSKSIGTSRRRVLHFLFGPRTLAHGLRWHTAV